MCARDPEAVSLFLKDGGRYEGTVGKDLFTGIWQITTSQASFLGNLRQDAIQFEIDDVEEVEQLDTY